MFAPGYYVDKDVLTPFLGMNLLLLFVSKVKGVDSP